MSAPVESYSSAVNGSAGNSAPVGGRRRAAKAAGRKLKTLKRKLAKLAKGGAEVEKKAEDAVEQVAAAEQGAGRKHVMGGRRRRSTRRRRTSRRSLFGLKY